MEFFATCNGIPVHIFDSKKGDNCIILLHGYLETLHIWQEFSTLLEKELRVVAIDLPGHGLSGTYQVNTMELCAETIVEVMKLLSIKRGYIAGHSMGGYVASCAVTSYPNLFDALIMINSTPFADSPEKRDNRDREIELIKQNRLQQLVKLSVANMFSPLNISLFEEQIIEICENAELHDPEGITSSLLGMKARPDYSLPLSHSTLPIQFIFGEQDNFISAEVANKVKSLLPNATYTTIPNSGHNSFIEQPLPTASTILNFINNRL